jgi:hypothetical protein
MNKFQKGVDQLLQKRGQIILGVTGYQYGGYECQVNDTDYFVCDVDETNQFDFGYCASPREFNNRELIFLLCGGMIKETSGYSKPEWQEIFYRNPAL